MAERKAGTMAVKKAELKGKKKAVSMD